MNPNSSLSSKVRMGIGDFEVVDLSLGHDIGEGHHMEQLAARVDDAGAWMKSPRLGPSDACYPVRMLGRRAQGRLVALAIAHHGDVDQTGRRLGHSAYNRAPETGSGLLVA